MLNYHSYIIPDTEKKKNHTGLVHAFQCQLRIQIRDYLLGSTAVGMSRTRAGWGRGWSWPLQKFFENFNLSTYYRLTPLDLFL